MPDEHAQRLLEAEQKARSLVETLAKLTGEIESYRTAQQELRGAGGRLSAAATALGDLASEATAVVVALRKVGTPEILDRVSHLEAAVGRLSTTEEEGLRDLRAAVLGEGKRTADAFEKVSATAADRAELVLRRVARVEKLLLATGGLLLLGLAALGWLALQ